jgi:hypothetical protein
MLAKKGQGDPWVAIGAGALLLASLMDVLLAFLEQGATRVIAARTAILLCYGGIAKVFQ